MVIPQQIGIVADKHKSKSHNIMKKLILLLVLALSVFTGVAAKKVELIKTEPIPLKTGLLSKAPSITLTGLPNSSNKYLTVTYRDVLGQPHEFGYNWMQLTFQDGSTAALKQASDPEYKKDSSNDMYSSIRYGFVSDDDYKNFTEKPLAIVTVEGKEYKYKAKDGDKMLGKIQKQATVLDRLTQKKSQSSQPARARSKKEIYRDRVNELNRANSNNGLLTILDGTKLPGFDYNHIVYTKGDNIRIIDVETGKDSCLVDLESEPNGYSYLYYGEGAELLIPIVGITEDYNPNKPDRDDYFRIYNANGKLLGMFPRVEEEGNKLLVWTYETSPTANTRKLVCNRATVHDFAVNGVASLKPIPETLTVGMSVNEALQLPDVTPSFDPGYNNQNYILCLDYKGKKYKTNYIVSDYGTPVELGSPYDGDKEFDKWMSWVDMATAWFDEVLKDGNGLGVAKTPVFDSEVKITSVVAPKKAARRKKR